MKVCIPTTQGTGLEDAVCEHFGSAPYFTICDLEAADATVVANDNAHHAHGTCHPLSQLADHAFDAIVCGGMGRRALEMLRQQGFKVYRATQPTVRDTLTALKAGELAELDAAHACGGHGHGSGHGTGLGQRHRHSSRER
ncbi:NifB/NifX family molybdenum-iron cluster-binding protein [bacterium]|nr:NifB/NifX family molybdenum-iron cluster-binding protein [bacterium]